MVDPIKIFRLVRESRWVKEYETSDGNILDSKYRMFKSSATAAEFVDAWQNASNSERVDMEAAFTYFPIDPPADVELVLATVALLDSERAERMRAKWVANLGELPIEQVRFQLGLGLYQDEHEIPYETVGSNRWFRVLSNDGWYLLENCGPDRPSQSELIEIERTATSPAYKRALHLLFGRPPFKEYFNRTPRASTFIINGPAS